MADVAARAGVGAITVSRAIRNPSRVSEALRRQIDEAIHALDYVPDRAASALASRHSSIVAVLIPGLSPNIFTDVLRGIYDGVGDSGLRIEIVNTRYDAQLEERLVAEILRHQPAGIIISGTEQSAATRKRLEQAGCPVVQIMDLSDDPIGTIIGFSHHEAARRMTAHMIERGYRRIGFVGGTIAGRSAGRLAGYRAALEEAGLYDPRLTAVSLRGPAEVEPPEVIDLPMARIGRERLEMLLERAPDLDAVFCNTDALAIGALFACHARGIGVGDDLGIAGFNDFDYMEAAEPTLSSVRTHRWRCGNLAMAAVRDGLAGRKPAVQVVDVGFDIVERRSTAGPALSRRSG
mgnify:CR=1 FL=1